MSKFKPAWLSPPCDTIQDFLEEFGGTEVLKERLGGGGSVFHRLMQNRRRITEPIAETLSKHLGSTPQFWLNRQRNYEQQASNCGDLLKIEKGTIGHQVNCQGKMGAGLAGKIAKRYPAVLREYREYLALYGPLDALGEYTAVDINPDLSVVNLFGQLDYGRDGRCYTDYTALRRITKLLPPILIHLPAQMGCGLGGGDWDVVQEIFADVDVIWVAGK